MKLKILYAKYKDANCRRLTDHNPPFLPTVGAIPYLIFLFELLPHILAKIASRL